MAFCLGGFIFLSLSLFWVVVYFAFYVFVGVFWIVVMHFFLPMNGFLGHYTAILFLDFS